MDHKEQLMSMLKSFINQKEEEASVALHDYFVSKSRQVTGIAGEATAGEYQIDNNEVR